MRESVLYAALRSFCIALFSMVGICLGIIPVILLFSLLSGYNETAPETKYTVEILPNAENIRKTMSKDAPVILNLDIHGVIGLETLNSQTVRRMLVESREDTLKKDRVKAILLNISTPGGTVTDADGIYRALKDYKEKYKVPIYAYVDGMCASGGMYVASAADKIYASDVSLIGSVGVIISSFLNVSQLMEKIGVNSLTLSAGKGKDDMNPLRPWKPGEQDNFKAIVDYYYDEFVTIVSSNRPKLSKEKLISVYGANVFPAEKAAEYGYIDGHGLSRNDTLKLLLKEIGIEDNYYQVVGMESKTWLHTLFNSQSTLFTGKVSHELLLPGELNSQLTNKYLYLYVPSKS